MALIWCAELPRLRPFLRVNEKEKNGCLNFKSAFKRAVWTGQTDDPQTYKKVFPPIQWHSWRVAEQGTGYRFIQ